MMHILAVIKAIVLAQVFSFVALPFGESKFIHLRFFSVTTVTDHPICTINGNFITTNRRDGAFM